MHVQELSPLLTSMDDLTHHHVGLRSQLQRALELAGTVILEQKPPSCFAFFLFRRKFQEFSAELQSYLELEEEALLPSLRGLLRNRLPVGDLSETIRLLRYGQETLWRVLSEMREETHGFEPPADAGACYGALLDVVRAIQAELWQEFYLENEQLFPRVLASADGSVTKIWR
jgi:iron-sulfur cluster repair protein YtfE (RIC family)